MKAIGRLFIAVFLFLLLGGTEVNGQTVAIGHVFAEVVESVSAASATISDFELSTSAARMKGDNLPPEKLDLGAITINSGRNITCNIVLTSASLSNDEGNAFTLDPSVKNEMLTSSAKSTGIQTIQLGANAHLNNDQASGLYEGTYTVVFAYN